MKTTRILALSGVAALLAASRLIFVSPVSAASTSLSNPKVEKVPGPDFQPAAYFANQRAAYQRDKEVHPEKYAATNAKEPEWFFTGKPYDADSKSYLFLYRNYRPDSASWMQPDPAGFPDGPNNYAYAPVPTIQIDPLGLNVSLGGAVGAWGDPSPYGLTYSSHTGPGAWVKSNFIGAKSVLNWSFNTPINSLDAVIIQHVVMKNNGVTISEGDYYEAWWLSFDDHGNATYDVTDTDTFIRALPKTSPKDYYTLTATGYAEWYPEGTDEYAAAVSWTPGYGHGGDLPTSATAPTTSWSESVTSKFYHEIWVYFE